MMRKAFLWFVFALLIGVVFADAISDYTVASGVPLNQKIYATGNFEDSNGAKNNFLCAFYFFDSNGALIYRATEQYTTTTGRFAMNGVELKEPYFVRGQQYSLKTECGLASADANFSVGQKQEAIDFFGFKFFPQSVGYDLVYFMNMDYTFAILFFIIVLGFLFYFGYIYLKSLGFVQ